MMIDIKKAKEKYNSTEIPQELETVVKDAINRGTKKQPIKLYFMRIAPVAVCAAVCFAIGINYFLDSGEGMPYDPVVTADFGDSDAIEYSKNEKSSRMAMPRAEVGEIDDFAPKEAVQADCAAETENARMDVTFHNSYVMNRFDESVNECVALETEENAYGEICEIYSDEEVVSYSVTTYPSNTVNFYNITQRDGADISIEDILEDSEYNSLNCKFYIKEKNKLVVICDGEEIEVVID